MNNYGNNNNRSGRSYGGGRSDRRDSGRSSFGRGNSNDRQMHDAVCDECGNNCKIPFVPSNGKPVYCSNCFEQRGGRDGDSGRDNRNDDYGRNSRNNESRRPSFTNRNDSAPRNERTERPQENYKKQFEIVNAKLDLILNELASKKEVEIVKEVKSKVEKKKAKKADSIVETEVSKPVKKVAKAKKAIIDLVGVNPEAEITE